MSGSSGHSDGTAVVADIGATNVRFARLTAGGAIGSVHRFAIRSFPDVVSALEAFVRRAGGPPPSRLALAIAGPIYSDEVKITNAHWRFSIRRLKRQLGLEQLVVLNDFEALARSLPYLGPNDIEPIGPQTAKPLPTAPRAVMGPGTGMGMAGLIQVGQAWHPVTTEGGYTSLSPHTEREIAVWQRLRRRHGRVSVERVLSGPGIAELYKTLCELNGHEGGNQAPERVVQMASRGDNRLAVETIDIFCAWLGDVAGDAALMFLASGGLYLAGSILNSISGILHHSRFRNRFENKGRAKNLIKNVPTFLITAEYPALLGCAHQLQPIN